MLYSRPHLTEHLSVYILKLCTFYFCCFNWLFLAFSLWVLINAQSCLNVTPNRTQDMGNTPPKFPDAAAPLESNPPSAPTHGNHGGFLPLYYFIFPRISYKRNHTKCSYMNLAFHGNITHSDSSMNVSIDCSFSFVSKYSIGRLQHSVFIRSPVQWMEVCV